MTLKRVTIASPNYSSRGAATVRLCVLHSSEGATSYQSLGNFFANPSSGVSSHVGISDDSNTIGEYVRRDYKAWTASNANPVAVQAELCCPSGASDNWTAADWHAHPVMLENTAAWIAEEAAHFGIPIVGLTAAQAQGGTAGVCQHADLGAWGGSHHDCGPGFPIGQVLDMARGATPPSPSQEEDDLPLHIVIGTQKPEWWVTDWITKRYIASPDQAAQIIVSTIATGGKIEKTPSNGPVAYDQATVDGVPTVK